MNIVIICGAILIAIYLIYEFRYHIMYFFSLLNVTNKNNKKINDLKKQGLNKRKVSNDEIEKYINFAREKLGKKTYNEFIIDQDLERHLRYSRFSEKYLEELFCKILQHIELNREELDFEVEYLSSKIDYGYVGLYYEKNEEKNAKILLIVRNDMIYDTVISTLAHECSHHLLLSKGISMEDRIDNECLTDITTILTGFGKYMIKGYEISNRVIYEKEDLRLVDKDRVGYLSSSDVKYVLKKIND